jgi:hypothetical protein
MVVLVELLCVGAVLSKNLQKIRKLQYMGCIVLIVVGDAPAYSGASSRYFGKTNRQVLTTLNFLTPPSCKLLSFNASCRLQPAMPT